MRSPSERLRTHLRSNIVGYVALFVALSATAWAAPKISSQDIAKNAVKAKHIKDGQVGTTEVGDNGLTGVDIDESTLQGLQAGPVQWGELQNVPAGFADNTDDNTSYSATPPLSLTGTTLGLEDCFANEILKHNGTNWECATEQSGGPPSGPAGGDLGGTYPNPSIAPKAVAGEEFGAVPAVSASGTFTDVPNNSASTAPLPAEQFDTSGMHAAGSNTFTVPQPGIYLINVLTEWSDGAITGGNAGNRTTSVSRDGVSTLFDTQFGQVPTPLIAYTTSGVAQLTPGDDITVTLFRSTATDTPAPDAFVKASLVLVSNP